MRIIRAWLIRELERVAALIAEKDADGERA